MPTVQPARGRGVGRLFRLLGVSRVVERPPVGGQAGAHSLDVIGGGHCVGELRDQHADVDVVELAAVDQLT